MCDLQSSYALQVLFCKLTDYQQELYEEYVTGPDVAAMLSGRKKVSGIL